MSTDLIDQPTAQPTRKLTWGTAAGIIGVVLTHFMVEIAVAWPFWFGWLDDPTTIAAVPLLMASLTGYVVRERAPA